MGRCVGKGRPAFKRRGDGDKTKSVVDDDDDDEYHVDVPAGIGNQDGAEDRHCIVMMMLMLKTMSVDPMQVVMTTTMTMMVVILVVSKIGA